MPSPDASSYVDLTLFDLNSQQIYLNALQYMRIALPEFQPVEGSIETVLLQAMALEVQDLVTSINRLPGGVVQALLGILGISRQEATNATALVKLYSATGGDVTIPAGLRMYASTTTGAETLVLTTDSSVELVVNKSISTLAQSGYACTATTVERHGFQNYDYVNVTVDGAHPASAAATCGGTLMEISNVPDDYTFVYTSASSATVAEVNVSATNTYATNLANIADGIAQVTASIPGYIYLAAGGSLQLLTSTRDVSSAVLWTDLDGGVNAESDNEYFTRASSSLNRMTSALVTAEQIAQYVASSSQFSYVYRVKAIDNCDIDRVLDTAGSTLVVAAKIGAQDDTQITEPNLIDIEEVIAPLTHPALTVSVDNAFLAYIDVSASVKARSGYTSVEVEAACTEALTAYLNPDTWDFSNILYKSELLTVLRNATIDGQPCVQYVSSVTMSVAGTNDATLRSTVSLGYDDTNANNGDIVDFIEFDDPAPLMQSGAFTITVT